MKVDLCPMLIRHFRTGVSIPVFLVLCLCGCGKDDAPPPALTLEQLPAAIEKAFAKARPESREKVSALLAGLRETDYPKALMALQAVSALPGLSREQASVAASGLVTLNNALQVAQTKGDQNAAQALQSYRSSK